MKDSFEDSAALSWDFNYEWESNSSHRKSPRTHERAEAPIEEVKNSTMKSDTDYSESYSKDLFSSSWSKTKASMEKKFDEEAEDNWWAADWLTESKHREEKDSMKADEWRLKAQVVDE